MVIVCEDSITRKLDNGKIVKGFYMNEKLKDNLDYEIKRVDKKWDAVILYDGEEGAAKTTFSSANAYYMSHERGLSFGLDNVVFTPDQFNDIVIKSPPYTNILWDEFVTAGLSVEALTSRIQIELIKRMTMIRKKRLVIHLVIPYIFMLSKYFAIARTRCLLHVYSENNLDRGDFKYYSKPNKRILYMKGIKFWEYKGSSHDFIGSFTDTFGLFYDTEEYEKKKDKAMMNLGNDMQLEKAGVRLCFVYLNLMRQGLTMKQIAALAEYKYSSDVRKCLKRYQMDQKAMEIQLNMSFKGKEGANINIPPIEDE